MIIIAIIFFIIGAFGFFVVFVIEKGLTGKLLVGAGILLCIGIGVFTLYLDQTASWLEVNKTIVPSFITVPGSDREYQIIIDDIRVQVYRIDFVGACPLTFRKMTQFVITTDAPSPTE